ncbi:aldo/keto reductase [Agrococcus jenensis]|uniref:Diketogulonate reductase-like aldo/keto reductase n=1 Tax=Agrococcus jenensis TaxID=46353 RepID=A0A3N2AUH8_9MICO|nr:aldo/keto reductase [Agrococcus jenensis]ROR66630.1 diketogulonate reductase-like aldo/keto reductase [Agrococcus jenensis]
MIPTTTAHSGLTLPVLGFGTYRLKGRAGSAAIERAIQGGYRLLDSAFNYENEGSVGAAARAADRHGVERGDLIVTSKLPGRHHAHDAAIATIEESVARTGLASLDLYLIHWPNPRIGQYVEAWGALVEAKERGLVGAIGVCNFLPEHLERLRSETGVLPEVNQVELHPYFPQEEQLAFDREHGIITQAWSPLGRGNDILDRPEIAEIAAAHEATAGQVVLAWAIARGAVPLPKAASAERQRENLGAVDVTLTDDEVAAITALGRADGRLADQDPRVYEEL